MRYTPSSIFRLEGAAMAGTQMNLRIDAKRRALERGLYLRDRLEAALGPCRLATSAIFPIGNCAGKR